ncbi:hypothetical protein FHS83_003772 [Rhizomicrobium palustre]|uniref:TonB C-terminal domain-containing protein n=1 Tax=Rhizomicrobium palustre TaxID=189966 RepID=A0A846N355_9PROT|nr:hypothetical protein [Rhizomicrobium palustre]NIK90454.1 hypothetical protein [Rhizomicrobium palustre]
MMKVAVFLAGAVMIAAPCAAGSLAEQFSSCAAKFSVKSTASVMLECNAADGKLNDCKVVTADGAANADKAALCVAEALPVGSKTGSIKVPIKFDPSK